MIGLIQRVNHASVAVGDETIAKIGYGLLAFIAVEKHDTENEVDKLLKRMLGYRILTDKAGKMNWGLKDTRCELLLVPQFTLAAMHTQKKGLRPSFDKAALPEHGEQLFDYMYEQAVKAHAHVQKGKFGADMQVTLTNDGPATFVLQASPEEEDGRSVAARAKIKIKTKGRLRK
ncbi:MAG: D-tyrosyl-tRNA(Tyr) deacylase [Thiotrichaceae bacterium]|nr:D-tyrosyl-tRNA(Tyr) deacylase [Thiotrichaceae bacterium]PCI12497.1 MAG: D-tyrosyl-tRNA(Tyr) deacylase [Thiotrichales bacterium]